MKFIIFFLFLTPLISFSETSKKMAKGQELPKLISISSLAKYHSKDLIFKTKAYVNFIYNCPPCPVGHLCKPCMGTNLVISESSKKINTYSTIGPKDMILYLNDTLAFEIGKMYEFKVKLRSVGLSHDKRTIYEGEYISHK